MTDPIQNLIAAAKTVVARRRGFDVHALEVAITAAEEAAEARPEPMVPPMARDWTIDFAHENGNYENRCTSCAQKFYGNKRRVTCRLCATKPEPAAEPDLVAVHLEAADDHRFNKTTDDWQELVMMSLRDAIKALACEVRR